MANLYHMDSPINREQRNNVNGTFQDIQQEIGKVVLKVGDVKDDIEAVKELSEIKVNELQNQVNEIVVNGDSSVEAAQARVGVDGTVYDVLKERLDVENEKIQDEINDFKVIKDDQKTAPLGGELLTQPSNWNLGVGWSGNTSIGFTYTHTGNIGELTYNFNPEPNKFYQLVFTVDSSDADHGFKLNATLGGSFPFEIYRGAGTNIKYENGIEAPGTEVLKIIPKANFAGTVSGISLKEIIGVIPPSNVVTTETDVTANESRITDPEKENLFVGKRSGSKNTSGYSNASYGHGSLTNNTSGYFNTSFGYNSLLNNTIGSRNVAMAYASLQSNITGHRNIALGTFALNRNTHGHNNIGVGADTLWYNTLGNHNIAMGLTSLEFNTTGNGNIGIGYRSLLNSEVANFNVSIGYDSSRRAKSGENVVVGAFSMDATTTGKQNTVIGSYAMRTNVTGERNSSLGSGSGSNSTGNNNVFVGYLAGQNLTFGSNNIFIGANTTTNTSSRANFLNIANSLYADTVNHTYGIGKENPTANLHITANTAARPILKFDAGVLTITKNAGGFEYDGNDLYFTKANGIRYKISMEVFN